ncbi:MAG: hypothetical protein KJO29_06900, partial [Bacteroidia bacterium]|nr:hypothetical protein [Bacteroidia bacterium]
MRTLFIIVLTFFVSGNFIAAQEYNVNWGPVYKRDSGNRSGYKLISVEQDGYYVLTYSNQGNMISKFDLNHNFISEVPLSFSRVKYTILLQDVIKTSAGTFLYMHYLDEQKKVWSLLVSEFQSGRFSDPRVVYSQKIDIKFSRLKQSFDAYQYGFGDELILSEDSTRVGFVNIIPGQDYKENEEIAVAVFDERMNLLWQTLHSFKFSRKDNAITQKEVSSFGELFLVGWIHKKRKGSKSGARSQAYLPQFEYILYEFRKDEIIEDVVNLGENVAPLDVALFFPDPSKKEFLLSGFYTDDDHKTRQKGLFFANGHPESGILASRMTEFKPRFLKDLVSDRAITKGKGLDLSFDINELLRFENGNLGFIAEKNYVNYTDNFNNSYYGSYGSIYSPYYGVYNNANRQRTPVYHTDDIVIPVFSADGEILSIQKIEKEYNSYSSSSTSYTMARSGGKAFLVFNDKKSKEERKRDDLKGSRFTDLVVIDSNGMIEYRETIFTNKDTDLDFVTTMSGSGFN